MMSRHILRAGVYAPVLTPFKDDECNAVDIDIFSAHAARLASADVGLIIGGTLGEGPLLRREERNLLTKCARETVRNLKLDHSVPVVTAVTGASVHECVDLAEDAARAGADAILLVAPAYFAFVYGKDRSAIKCFFTSVADKSPLPVFLYNIPFAAGGIDMDAAFLVDISEHQNIVGVKLTCLNVAKGHRVALHVNAPEYRSRHPLPFLVLPGSSDYLLPAIVGRQHGCMAGPANIYPKVCVKIYRTATEALRVGSFELLCQAQELQDLLTESDSVINKVGFLGIKTAIGIHVDKNLDGAFRKPLPAVGQAAIEELRLGLAKIMEIENSL